MTRKQTAYRIIANQAETIIFDIDCGDERLANKSKVDLVELIYMNLLNSSVRAQHFKFLTAEWIKETITSALEKYARKWGVELQ